MKRLLKRRDFLALAGAGVVGLGGMAFLRRKAGAEDLGLLEVTGNLRPNILIILADDLGYGELSVQGCQDIPTPHVDSLAANGVRFTNGYVSWPVCAPTRAGLLTGRYQQRFGFETNPGPEQSADPAFGLPLREATLAERLKPLGYMTGLFGKWHLGYRPEAQPTRRGFDEFFGFLSGAHRYLAGQRPEQQNPLLRGTESVEEKEYLTDALAHEAVSFIERHQDQPFFLYLAFNAVHAPLQATDAYRARFPHLTDPRRRTIPFIGDFNNNGRSDKGTGSWCRAAKTRLGNFTIWPMMSGNRTTSPTSGRIKWRNSRRPGKHGTQNSCLHNGTARLAAGRAAAANTEELCRGASDARRRRALGVYRPCASRRDRPAQSEPPSGHLGPLHGFLGCLPPP